MKAFTLAVLFLCSISAPAQTFRGSISGTLTDTTGAALPEATVRLDSPATGLTRTIVSSATGEYLFPDLPVGMYSITATHPGFAAKKIDNIQVAVSRVTNLNIQLGVAQQQQVVEVSASAVTLETTSTALVGVVNTKTVEDLPMNGRDFRQMIKLAPGVSPSTTSVNGMRTSGNNYQIDGADNNDAFQNAAAVNQGGVSGIAGTLLPIEAIDQFSVESNAGADVGRNGGSRDQPRDQVRYQRSSRQPVLLQPQRGTCLPFGFPAFHQPEAGHPQQPVRFFAGRPHRQEPYLLFRERRIAALDRQQLDPRSRFLPAPGSLRPRACWRSMACRSTRCR